MKSISLPIVALAMAAGALQAADSPLKTDKDKQSYSLGMDIGSDLKKAPLELNADMVAKGLGDSLSGGKTLLTEEESKQILQQLQQEAREKMQASQQKASGENKAAADKFLAENKTKDGVKTTASGLQYKVEKEGTGPKPTADSEVTVHYRGTLLSGTEFDSSYSRNQPATFPLGGVIPGWTEGLQLMSEGSKFKFWIPANLAYGEQGPPSIGPNQMLTFDVELLKIGKAEDAAKTGTDAAPAPDKK